MGTWAWRRQALYCLSALVELAGRYHGDPRGLITSESRFRANFAMSEPVCNCNLLRHEATSDSFFSSRWGLAALPPLLLLYPSVMTHKLWWDIKPEMPKKTVSKSHICFGLVILRLIFLFKGNVYLPHGGYRRNGIAMQCKVCWPRLRLHHQCLSLSSA